MAQDDKVVLTVKQSINAPVSKVWDLWTDPFHILHWNQASDQWQTSYAENDLRVGGKFLSRMEARDGSSGFDFTGIYDEIVNQELIKYHLDDGIKDPRYYFLVQ